MADIVVFLIASIVMLGGLLLYLWATTTRRQDARIAQLEAKQTSDLQYVVKQFWRHETVIQQNVATAERAEKQIVQLATNFARAQTTSANDDPFGKTVPGDVFSRQTLRP